MSVQNDVQATISVKMMKPLSKVLFAVSDLVKAHRVVFDLEEYGGSYLEHRATQGRVRVHLERGTYFVYLWYRLYPSKAFKKAKDPVAMDVDVVDKPDAAKEGACPFVGQEATPP